MQAIKQTKYRQAPKHCRYFILTEKRDGQMPVPLRMVFLPNCKFDLLQELENALRNLVGLRQHCLSRLNQDVVLGVSHHLVGNVGVADGGLSVLNVLGHDAQVVLGVLQTVLDSAQIAAGGGHGVDGVLDGLDSGGGAVLIGDGQVGKAQSLGVHIAHVDLHLVEAVSGVANLQSELLAGVSVRVDGAGGIINGSVTSSGGSVFTADLHIGQHLIQIGLLAVGQLILNGINVRVSNEILNVSGSVSLILLQLNFQLTAILKSRRRGISTNGTKLDSEVFFGSPNAELLVVGDGKINGSLIAINISRSLKVRGLEAVHAAVQQLLAVEVGAVGDAVDLALEGGDFLLEVQTVDLVVVGAVSGLGSQRVHAVEHVVNFLQSALSGLNEGYAVLDVLVGGLQTGDLSAHLLGNSQTGGVVTGAVDLVAGGQLLQVLGQGGGVVGVVAVGVHRHDVMLDPHFDRFLSF